MGIEIGGIWFLELEFICVSCTCQWHLSSLPPSTVTFKNTSTPTITPFNYGLSTTKSGVAFFESSMFSTKLSLYLLRGGYCHLLHYH